MNSSSVPTDRRRPLAERLRRLESAGLRAGVLGLGFAGAVEYATQLLVPVVLVRTLSVSEFGEYRILWMLLGTALALFPLFIPNTLFYFVPRSLGAQRGVLLRNTLAILGVASVFATLATWAVIAAGLHSLAALSPLSVPIAVLAGAWVMTSLWDTMPSADGRLILQALSRIALAALRTVLICGFAYWQGSFAAVLTAILLACGLKLALTLAYAGAPALAARGGWGEAGAQLRYAIPFALGSGLFLMRAQADQWVVTLNFEPTAVALTGTAAVVLGFSSVLRQPVMQGVLPHFSRRVADGDMGSAADLMAAGYRAMAIVFLPALGFLFALARDLVELVYTANYLGAVPLMRVYLIGQIAGCYAAGYLMAPVNRGRAAALISAGALVLSIALSWIGAQRFGLIGAVIGSTVAVYLAESGTLLVVRMALGQPLARLIDARVSLVMLGAVVAAVAGSMALRAWLFVPWPAAARALCTAASFAAILAALAFLLARRLPWLRRAFADLFSIYGRRAGKAIS